MYLHTRRRLSNPSCLGLVRCLSVSLSVWKYVCIYDAMLAEESDRSFYQFRREEFFFDLSLSQRVM